MRENKILVASAVAIMMAPAALNALPTQNVDASAVGTVTKVTPVYASTGKANGTTLPAGSQWKLGQQITLNGVAHYMVGTNEYIPASMVSNVTGSANSEDDSQTVGRYVADNPDAGKTVVADQALDIVDNYGNSTGKAVPSGSQWVIGQVLHVNKQVYYQVATNEWISAQGVTVVNPTTDNTSGTDSTSTASKDANYGKTGTVKNVAKVFDDKGVDTGVVLPTNSQWILGNHMELNGIEYYQVATNEWVTAPDISIAGTTSTNDNTSSGNGSYIVASKVAGQVGTLNSNAAVVDGSGIDTGATLQKGTSWKLGGNLLSYDNQAFYQVATNQYVSVAYMDVQTPSTTTTTNTNTNTNSSVPTPGNGLVGTTNKTLRTYNTSKNSYDMTLPAQSTWKISKLVVNKYGSYWGEVATNQWVWITDVTLNSGLNLKDNSYYEPEFATSINK
ncbi:hypothetical protein FHL06_04010 [Lactobacillus halodurans]|uniref:S-layer protein C-terminal domain-containing protein n=1 Tax=Companilactobacillus halodurans TaxID=2584183 RepID=A0A5P0ZMZ6_9LACO|nr:SLAP domain-containing protein [Companilactobacillus halodurans]MQS75556.1 hypothetical protein [Companilactobacillus halodurans]